MTRRVIVTDYNFPNLDKEQNAAYSNGAKFSSFQCQSEKEVEEVVKGADIVIVQFANITAKAIEGIVPGGAILRYGIGYDNIDIQAASKAGIQVGYVPDYCINEVADHTVASLLYLLRKLGPLDSSVRRGEWKVLNIAEPMKPFHECLLGFFGFGQIGRAVHQRLIPFGFSFLVSDPVLSVVESQKLKVKKVTSEELFAVSDALSLHAPANLETTEFVNANLLKTMKSNAVIVNTARGALIHEDDLANALKNSQIAGAALDVFQKEPLLNNSPLRDAPNLLITPHAAWYSDKAIDRLQEFISQDITNHLNGLPLRKPIPK